MMENIDFSWMAWSLPTAIFFTCIGAALILMALAHFWKPGGAKLKTGALFGLATTRGDRLFISLLGSAYIHLAWLGFTDQALWWASIISIAAAAAIFRWG